MSKWLLTIIKLVIEQASPEIRGLVCRALESAAEKAAETDNPWDDVLIGLIQTLAGCEKE